MSDRDENRCEYCLRLHEGDYVRWCSETCAANWMHQFYWPLWHTVLAKVLEMNPDADPREIHGLTDEQAHWIAGGPSPLRCGKLSDRLAGKG